MPDLTSRLLGRIYVPDTRDWPLEAFLPTESPLDAALAALLSSRETKATKVWAKAITDAVKALGPAPAPPPTPTPPPPTPSPTNDVVWKNAEATLDQGNTPECVGFGWAQWGNTLPVDDKYTAIDGDAIYKAAKVIDGDNQDGTTVRSGAKAMKDRGRVSAYAFTTSFSAALTFLHSTGPLVFGIDWYESMFTPDSKGYVSPSGSIAGGHAFAVVGDLVSEGGVLCQNSWGKDWGINGGFFKMKYADAASLLNANGDACASVELPLA